MRFVMHNKDQWPGRQTPFAVRTAAGYTDAVGETPFRLDARLDVQAP